LKPQPIASLGILFPIGAAVCVAELPSIVFANSAVVAAPSQCEFRRSNGRWTGSCGAGFDEMPVFSIAPMDLKISGRGDRIRTCDIYVPNHGRYRHSRPLHNCLDHVARAILMPACPGVVAPNGRSRT
jgi:hypothetical protein